MSGVPCFEQALRLSRSMKYALIASTQDALQWAWDPMQLLWPKDPIEDMHNTLMKSLRCKSI